MPSVEVNFLENLTFEGQGSSGHKVRMDGDSAEGHASEGTRPMELVLTAVGGCTGIDVVSMLAKMRVPLESFSMRIEGDRDDHHPRVYRYVRIEYRFDAQPEDGDKIIRAVRLSQEKYCSVSLMVNQTARMEAVIILNGQNLETLSFPSSFDNH